MCPDKMLPTCPCSEVSGNVNLVAHRILEKLPQDDRWGACRVLAGDLDACTH
jgi:hypothetical protein